jgi:hypothetical protein
MKMYKSKGALVPSDVAAQIRAYIVSRIFFLFKILGVKKSGVVSGIDKLGFKKIDVNNNKCLTKKELFFQAYKYNLSKIESIIINAVFKLIDTNHDGCVTLKEYLNTQIIAAQVIAALIKDYPEIERYFST